MSETALATVALRVFSLSLMVSALTRLPQLAVSGDLVFETGFVLLPAVIEAASGCLIWLCAPSIANRTVPADSAAPSRVAFSFDADRVVSTAVLLMGIFIVVDALSRLAGSLVSMGLEQRAGSRLWTEASTVLAFGAWRHQIPEHACRLLVGLLLWIGPGWFVKATARLRAAWSTGGYADTYSFRPNADDEQTPL